MKITCNYRSKMDEDKWLLTNLNHVNQITRVQINPVYHLYLQVHLNKLKCRGKVNFSNSTQIVKLVY